MDSKKYLLIGVGNFTLTLRGTYREIVNDALGRPIAPRTIRPLQVVFNNGVPVEVDEELLGLIKQTPDWGNTIAFLPVSLPKDAPEDEKAMSKRMAKDVESRLTNKREARIRAREGSVSPESNESFD